MKHITILAPASKKKDFLSALGDLAAVHVNIRPGNSQNLETLKELHQQINRAVSLIPVKAPAKKPGRAEGNVQEKKEVHSNNEAQNLALHILDIQASIEEQEKELDVVQNNIKHISSWGNFTPQVFTYIARVLKGKRELSGKSFDCLVQLASISKQLLPSLDIPYIIIGQKRKTYQLFLLADPYAETSDRLSTSSQSLPTQKNRPKSSSEHHIQPGAIEIITIPQKSLSDLRKEAEELQKKIRSAKDDLASLQNERMTLQTYLKGLEMDIHCEEVHISTQTESQCPLVVRIEGFLPQKSLDSFKAFSHRMGSAYILRDPDPDELVPTKVETSRVLRITQPLFTFMDTLPGYREQDISFWFLLFFMLFFAMIIGDAGYGSLLIIASLTSIVVAKSKRKPAPQVAILCTVLGFATLVWGAISGNWFGYAPIADLPILNQFVIPSLDAFAEGVEAQRVVNTILIFCFSLGMGHLILAHLLALIKKLRDPPGVHAFADLGWMLMLFALYFLVLNLVVDSATFPIPPFALPLIIAGFVLVILFSGQEGDGFFRGLARTLNIGNLIHTSLTAISSFADIISYIRLFAVGLASVEIARSFNAMATGIFASGGAVAIIAGIIVLVLGHSLNIVMGGLSVLVHGIRLKMLEFSGHLGNEWTGFAYKPFIGHTHSPAEHIT